MYSSETDYMHLKLKLHAPYSSLSIVDKRFTESRGIFMEVCGIIMNRKFVPTADQKTLILKLHSEGFSVPKIVEATSICSPYNMYRLLKEWNPPKPIKPPQTQKRCNLCGETKKVNNFLPRKDREGFYCSGCISCRELASKERAANKFRLSDTQKKEIEELYSNDISMTKISMKLEVSTYHIKNYLNSIGIYTGNLIKFSDETKEKVIKLKLSGASYKQIRDELGVSYKGSSKICKDSGLDFRTEAEKLRDIGKKLCSACSEVKVLSQFYHHPDRKGLYLSICKFCRFNSREIEQICRTCNKNFTLHYPRSECRNCFVPRVDLGLCYESVEAEALKYKYRSVFRSESSSYYNWACRNKVLQEVCEHMGDRLYSGFGKTGFIDACNRNKGTAILYLIKMYKDHEWFYKIGRTCQTLKARYSGTSRNFGYSYDVLWQIEADPVTVFDLEVEYCRKIKQFRYVPTLWPSKNPQESFICDQNSDLLVKPIYISPDESQ